MTIFEQQRPEPTPIPGVAHATWAGQAQGLTQLSLWRQTLAPGAATPPHRHDCDEIVMCVAGEGELHLGGEVRRFGPASTVVLPANALHQLFSVGTQPLELIAVLGASPVHVTLPDGHALDLPWPT